MVDGEVINRCISLAEVNSFTHNAGDRMTVYLTQGMAFKTQQKHLLKDTKSHDGLNGLRPLSAQHRPTFHTIFRAFFISSLIFINIGLLVVAALWLLLVFSVVPPTELIGMYTFQNVTTVAETEQEYTLELVSAPPPLLAIDNYGGLGKSD